MNANTERKKKIEAMMTQLRKMRKHSEVALKKTEAQLRMEELKYRRELADFQKKYGS